MKLQPLFTVKSNELYTAGGTPVHFKFIPLSDLKIPAGAQPGDFFLISIAERDVAPAEDSYDEAFLARFRDFLKTLEENGQFAVLHIVPGDADGVLHSGADSECVQSYVSCVKHTARRVKDCASVAGVEIDGTFAAEHSCEKVQFLIDELKVKHPQYVYFADGTLYERISSVGCEYTDMIVVEKGTEN